MAFLIAIPFKTVQLEINEPFFLTDASILF